jgi:hypothetical protein
MSKSAKAVRAVVATALLVLLSACGKVGVDAGGETSGSNGGVAFIILAGFLVFGALVLWFILGRED